jgi:hypothetical protein
VSTIDIRGHLGQMAIGITGAVSSSVASLSSNRRGLPVGLSGMLAGLDAQLLPQQFHIWL